MISGRVKEVHVGDPPSVGDKATGDIPLLEDLDDENVFDLMPRDRGEHERTLHQQAMSS